MGAEDFESYYRDIYADRWAVLREALLGPAAAAAYAEGLIEPYYLDRGSILAARSLRIPSEGEILDACAAPGGKTLVLAGSLDGDGELRILSNELSSDRRRRLSDVLDRHLEGTKRSRVTVSGFDAAALAARKGERERFAAILLDAPCSSERHVLASPKALAEWSAARPRFLSRRQWALLSSAFLLLAPGGSLVYSTCALSPEENDGVAGRLLKKYGEAAELDTPDFTEGEETGFGRIILPDAEGGMGPMYVARFRKRA